MTTLTSATTPTTKSLNPTALINEQATGESATYWLTNETEFLLHTKMAVTLVNGEWRVGHLGLRQFQKLIGILHKAFKADDPYAEQHLLKTFDALEEAIATLTEQEKNLQQQITNIRGFKIEIFKNPNPIPTTLHLSPFFFRAAELVERVDYVHRQLYTLRRMGLTPVQDITPYQLFSLAQSVFKCPMRWRQTGITRQAILDNTEKAQEVQKLLGKIPQDVLTKKIEFKFLQRPKEK